MFTTDSKDNGICQVVQNSTGKIKLVGIELKTGLCEVTLKSTSSTDKCLKSSTIDNTSCIWNKRLKHSSSSTIYNSLDITTGIKLQNNSVNRN